MFPFRRENNFSVSFFSAWQHHFLRRCINELIRIVKVAKMVQCKWEFHVMGLGTAIMALSRVAKLFQALILKHFVTC